MTVQVQCHGRRGERVDRAISELISKGKFFARKWGCAEKWFLLRTTNRVVCFTVPITRYIIAPVFSKLSDA
jgi:hypothetical protein